jgi:hypothetical protein
VSSIKYDNASGSVHKPKERKYKHTKSGRSKANEFCRFIFDEAKAGSLSSCVVDPLSKVDCRVLH